MATVAIGSHNAKVLIGPPTGLLTTESGTTAEIQVVLTSQPASAITYRLYSTAVNEGVPSPGTLTFTPENWDIPQTVTVTGVDDNVPDGDRSYRVALTADTLADSLYAGWDAGSAELTNLDDDIVSYSVTIDSGLSAIRTTEGGGSDTLTVVLDSQPQSDIVIGITSLDPGEGQTANAEANIIELLFTPTTWNEPQVATIQGVDDDNQDGDVAYTLLVDLDRDNIFDGDELVLQNYEVIRTWAGPNGTIGDADDLTYSEYTDEDGRFKFAAVTAGMHRVQVIFEELTIAGSSTYTSTFDIPLQVDEQYSNAYMRVLGNDFDSDGISNEIEGNH